METPSPRSSTARPVPLPHLFAGTVLATLLLSPRLGAVDFDSIAALQGVLPQKTDHYEIVKEVKVEPPYLVFQVNTDHGTYDVQSVRNLLKTCHEIRVMEEYRKTEEGNQTWQGAKDSFKDIGSGAKMLVKDPNAARKAIGRSLSKTARSIGRFFRKQTQETPERKSSEGRDRDLGAGGKTYAKTARQFAHRMQLDVYTDNPYAKALIGSVAEQQGVGKAAVGVATFLLAPVPGLRTVTRGSLTSDAINAETEILIADNSPAELRYQMRKKFLAANGLVEGRDKEAIAAFDAFLTNGNFNPRQEAYLGLHLELLGNLPGRAEAIQALGEIKTETDADLIVSQYEILTAIHRKKAKLSRLVPFGANIAGLAEGGELFFGCPFDKLADSEFLNGLAEDLKQAARSAGAKRTRWMILGPASGEFHGIAVSGDLLSDPDLTK